MRRGGVLEDLFHTVQSYNGLTAYLASLKEPPEPKAVVFVLDVSASMFNPPHQPVDRFSTCKTSILNIIREHCEPNDYIALVSFATDVQVDLELKTKASHSSQHVDRLVNHMKLRGATAFYDGLLRGFELLSVPEMHTVPKWLIALTDGLDTASYPESVDKACNLFQATPKTNLALITVDGEPALGCCNCCPCTKGPRLDPSADPAVVRKFLHAARGGMYAGTSVHIHADSQEAITKAFEDISKRMTGAALEIL